MSHHHFLVVAGNIGVGKSTLVEGLARRLGWQAAFEPHAENPYLADFYQSMATWSFHSQTFFLSKRLEQHFRIGLRETSVPSALTARWGDLEATADVTVVALPLAIELTPRGELTLPVGQVLPFQIWAASAAGERVEVAASDAEWRIEGATEEAGSFGRAGMGRGRAQPVRRRRSQRRERKRRCLLLRARDIGLRPMWHRGTEPALGQRRRASESVRRGLWPSSGR